MKLALLTLLSAPMAAAFAPPTTFRSATKLNAIDPSAIHDLSQHHAVAADSINHFFSSLMISDLDTAVDAAATIPMDAAPGAATDAAAAAANDNGWFGFLTGPIESLLKLIHNVLTSVGLSEDAWGVSIIAMTVLIKALTFPLTKSQLESTNKMQVRIYFLNASKHFSLNANLISIFISLAFVPLSLISIITQSLCK